MKIYVFIAVGLLPAADTIQDGLNKKVEQAAAVFQFSFGRNRGSSGT